MKKICIVTAARSEYGLLRWVIDEVYKSRDLELQLIVTGGHLSEEQGYTYKAIDCLITNFHLPKSTLLMLVSALASKENIFKAYEEAINNNYRFFSFGDSMFIKKDKN